MASTTTTSSESVLNGTEAKPFLLISKVNVSHNTKLFTFALPNENDQLHLPIGRHIRVCVNLNGRTVMRSYTPISEQDKKGSFDLLIKRYETGTISPYVHALEPGSTLDIKGPTGTFNYVLNKWKHVAMLAGGTGITPMLQVLRAIVGSSEEKAVVSLLYSNTTEDDILLKDVLDNLAQKHKERVNVHYTVSKPSSNQTSFYTGRITAEMVKSAFPKPEDGVLVMVCGPSGFNTSAIEILETLGYTKEMIHKC